MPVRLLFDVVELWKDCDTPTLRVDWTDYDRRVTYSVWMTPVRLHAYVPWASLADQPGSITIPNLDCVRGWSWA
jgi:hypothetical protein